MYLTGNSAPAPPSGGGGGGGFFGKIGGAISHAAPAAVQHAVHEAVTPHAAPPRQVVPPSYGLGQALGRSVARSGNTISQSVNRASSPHSGWVNHGGTDAQSSGPGYGSNDAASVRATIQQLLGNRGLSAPIVKSSPGGGFNPLAMIDTAPLVGGAIHGLGDVAGGALHLGENFGKGLINLAPNLVQGGVSMAKALAHDATAAIIGMTNPMAPHDDGGSATYNLAKGMVTSDPLYQGFVKGNWKAAYEHPLNVVLDATGVYGLAGKGAGALARSGAIGDRAAALGNMQRADHVLIPSNPESAVAQHYSPNIITKAAQVYRENHPSAVTAAGKPSRATVKALNKQVDFFQQGRDNAEHKVMESAVKAIHDTKPADKTTAAMVAHATMGSAGGPAAFLDNLKALHDQYATEAPALSGDALKANQANRANIRDFLEHPDVQEAFKSGGAAAARQQEIDGLLGRLGLRPQSQLDQRAIQSYAQTQMGAKIVPPRAFASPQALAARDMSKDIKSAVTDYANANREHQVTLAKAGAQADKGVAEARLNLQRADANEALARRSIASQYGGDVLHSVEGKLTGKGVRMAPKSATPADAAFKIPDHAAMRLDSAMRAVDDAAKALHEAEQYGKQHVAETQQYGLNVLAAKKDALQDARLQFANHGRQYLTQKIGGTVIHDPAAPVIKSGTFKGQQLRPVGADEVRAHMESTGTPHAEYVNLSIPKHQNWLTTQLSRGGSRGARNTGTALQQGTYRPGYGAISNSQLLGYRQILKAQGHDEFIKRFADPGVYNDRNIAQALQDYRERTGLEGTAVSAHPKSITDEQASRINALQDPKQAATATTTEALQNRLIDPHNPGPENNLRIVPKVQMDRYLQHQGIEPVVKMGGSRGPRLTDGSLMSGVNRQLRLSALPFSTKLFLMHAGENATRIGALGGPGNLIGKAPAAYRLAGKVDDSMRAQGLGDAADHLQGLTMPGAHTGVQMEQSLRHIEARDPNTYHPIVEAVRNANDAYERQFANRIFAVHRAIEQQGQRTMLGMHMQRQLQELAGSTLKAHTQMNQYIDELARGYASPKMAEDAAKYVHEAGGQYNAFSPVMKALIGRVAPFLPWYTNAAKFVYHTMPVGHPAATAAALDAAHSSPQINPNDVPHSNIFGVPSGTFLSDLKTGPSDYLDLGRFSPAGITDPNALLSMPWTGINSAVRAVLGQDPFGGAFRGPGGVEKEDLGHRALYGLNQLLESVVPGLAPAVRVFEDRGRTPYNTSTLWDPRIKPGTAKYGGGIPGGLWRTFWPLQSVHLGGASHGGSGGGSGGSSSGLGSSHVGGGGLGSGRI